MHATLAAAPLDANSAQVEQVAALYARVLGADQSEAAAAVAKRVDDGSEVWIIVDGV